MLRENGVNVRKKAREAEMVESPESSESRTPSLR
jgi:hypothetical protein